jgi:hypothetical protein
VLTAGAVRRISSGKVVDVVADFKYKVTFDECTVINESDKAILVECPDWGMPRWWPQSQVDDDSECWHRGDTGTLTVSEWIAREKGLI